MHATKRNVNPWESHKMENTREAKRLKKQLEHLKTTSAFYRDLSAKYAEQAAEIALKIKNLDAGTTSAPKK